MAGKVTVYLKAEQCIEVKKPDVTVGDLMAIECTDPIMLSKLKTIKVLKINDKEQKRYVMSILRVIELIHRQYPEVDIQNLGAQDMIIVYEKQQTPNRLFHLCKTAAVVLISFVGAAFSIMAFQNDVAMAKLFGQIYELLTGSPSDGFTILELTYSVGLTIGILIFFNHFGGRKFAVDPTPMEVEMRLYENDIQTTLIQNYSREQVEIDAGEPHPKGRGGSV